MSQKGSGKRRQAPAYSADAMAIRYMAGLALIALGALIFMAVALKLSGNIFEGLRRLCFGLCGIMAYVLPGLPLWAGILVICSTQRRVPVRPWLYALLAFFGLCAFMMITGAMGWLDGQYGGNWGAVIHGAYTDSAERLERASGGGACGAALAWPLWKFLGPVLGTVIVFLLTALSVLMALNLTPSRIRDLVTGQAGARREQQRQERQYAEQQQLAWQQQAAMQQQQAWIMEQQQAYTQPGTPPAAMPGQMPTAYQEQGYRQPSNGESIRNWQDQAAEQRTMTQTGHQSSIFGKKSSGKVSAPEKHFASRIFGLGKKEAYDGLSDGPTPEEIAARTAAAAARPSRKTVSGEPAQPQTHWARPAEPVKEQEQPIRTGEAVREEKPQAEQQTPPRQPQISRPAGKTEQETLPDDTPYRRRPARTEQETSQDDTNYRRQPARAEQETPPDDTPYRRRPARAEQEEDKPVRQVPAVPVVEPIGEEAYRPKIKVTQPKKTAEEDEDEGPWMPTPYHYPPITDLAPPRQGAEDTSGEDEMRSRKLEETLASFKVQARVVNVTHGPAISRFEMELAAGTKVNKVSELEKDIAYGMSATSVRIEAPIPGKSLVGVEVPNRKVTTVTLREVMESEKMQNAKSILTVALGKDIAGTPIVCDLAKMPHMLIAGQTGSGKSVCINAIINSLLYRAGPDEVKMILVDPKVVELQCYNGIPHLLIPVVNDPHKAAAALAWAVAEMMERYDKFAERKVRNLEGFNQLAEKTGEKPMARIVIIIDELADLMMVCKKDVEEYICRLTQLARAAGIHLIVATQRPSVDVITGLIKANIPSRIAFKTASSVDSRTILDRNGSEQLLGWGDMLYAPTGSFSPTRVQGCFLSDEEVNRIVKHVRDANPSTYDPDILEKLDQLASGGGETGGADIIINSSDMNGGDGGLFEQAVEFAIQDGQISTSTLQRRLKIGYARAGRLTDEMEERGIVAAKDGSKPRKCLITREEWEEMKKSTEGMA